jgi:LCP family protein required for cell wall assembly
LKEIRQDPIFFYGRSEWMMSGRHLRQPNQNPPRRRRSRRKAAIISSVVAACLAVGGGVAYYGLHRPLKASPVNPQYTSVAEKQQPPSDPNRTNILLIGADTRPGQVGGNTDVLILCSIDREHKRIELLSIPRDTKVKFPDGSDTKINEALSVGGPQLTERLVSQLLDIHIDDYALTHFGGLVKIIDTIGGIRLDVPERMYYRTGDKQYGVINLQPGVQTLNGAQALGFVRFRHDKLGDIGRTERQQEFLKALSEKLLQPANILKLPQLVREFWGTIDTDMNLAQVISLAAHAEEYKQYHIITETLPGSFHNPDPNIPHDVSYWLVNPAEAKYVAKQFFDDGVRIKNPVQDPYVTEHWTPSANTTGKASTGETGNSIGNAGGDSTVNGSGTENTTGGSVSTVSGAGNDATGTQNNLGNAAHPPSPEATKMVVTGRTVNVRSGPGSNYSIIASAVAGDTVWELGTVGSWVKVELTSGSIGYIANWLVQPAG